MDHHRLTRRVIERHDRATHERDAVDDHNAVDVKIRHERQRRRANGHQGLGDDHDALTIPAIGQRAPKQPENRVGQVEKEAQHADGFRRVREVEDQPRLGGVLQPRSDLRDQLAGKVEPVVAMAPQTGEHVGVKQREFQRRAATGTTWP